MASREYDVTRRSAVHLSLPGCHDYVITFCLCVCTRVYLDAGRTTEFYVRDFDMQTFKTLHLIRVTRRKRTIQCMTTDDVRQTINCVMNNNGSSVQNKTHNIYQMFFRFRMHLRPDTDVLLKTN